MNLWKLTFAQGIVVQSSENLSQFNFFPNCTMESRKLPHGRLKKRVEWPWWYANGFGVSCALRRYRKLLSYLFVLKVSSFFAVMNLRLFSVFCDFSCSLCCLFFHFSPRCAFLKLLWRWFFFLVGFVIFVPQSYPSLSGIFKSRWKFEVRVTAVCVTLKRLLF